MHTGWSGAQWILATVHPCLLCIAHHRPAGFGDDDDDDGGWDTPAAAVEPVRGPAGAPPARPPPPAQAAFSAPPPRPPPPTRPVVAAAAPAAAAAGRVGSFRDPMLDDDDDFGDTAPRDAPQIALALPMPSSIFHDAAAGVVPGPGVFGRPPVVPSGPPPGVAPIPPPPRRKPSVDRGGGGASRRTSASGGGVAATDRRRPSVRSDVGGAAGTRGGDSDSNRGDGGVGARHPSISGQAAPYGSSSGLEADFYNHDATDYSGGGAPFSGRTSDVSEGAGASARSSTVNSTGGVPPPYSEVLVPPPSEGGRSGSLGGESSSLHAATGAGRAPPIAPAPPKQRGSRSGSTATTVANPPPSFYSSAAGSNAGNFDASSNDAGGPFGSNPGSRDSGFGGSTYAPGGGTAGSAAATAAAAPPPIGRLASFRDPMLDDDEFGDGGGGTVADGSGPGPAVFAAAASSVLGGGRPSAEVAGGDHIYSGRGGQVSSQPQPGAAAAATSHAEPAPRLLRSSVGSGGAPDAASVSAQQQQQGPPPPPRGGASANTSAAPSARGAAAASSRPPVGRGGGGAGGGGGRGGRVSSYRDPLLSDDEDDEEEEEWERVVTAQMRLNNEEEAAAAAAAAVAAAAAAIAVASAAQSAAVSNDGARAAATTAAATPGAVSLSLAGDARRTSVHAVAPPPLYSAGQAPYTIAALPSGLRVVPSASGTLSAAFVPSSGLAHHLSTFSDLGPAATTTPLFHTAFVPVVGPDGRQTLAPVQIPYADYAAAAASAAAAAWAATTAAGAVAPPPHPHPPRRTSLHQVAARRASVHAAAAAGVSGSAHPSSSATSSSSFPVHEQLHHFQQAQQQLQSEGVGASSAPPGFHLSAHMTGSNTAAAAGATASSPSAPQVAAPAASFSPPVGIVDLQSSSAPSTTAAAAAAAVAPAAAPSRRGGNNAVRMVYAPWRPPTQPAAESAGKQTSAVGQQGSEQLVGHAQIQGVGQTGLSGAAAASFLFTTPALAASPPLTSSGSAGDGGGYSDPISPWGVSSRYGGAPTLASSSGTTTGVGMPRSTSFGGPGVPADVTGGGMPANSNPAATIASAGVGAAVVLPTGDSDRQARTPVPPPRIASSSAATARGVAQPDGALVSPQNTVVIPAILPVTDAGRLASCDPQYVAHPPSSTPQPLQQQHQQQPGHLASPPQQLGQLQLPKHLVELPLGLDESVTRILARRRARLAAGGGGPLAAAIAAAAAVAASPSTLLPGSPPLLQSSNGTPTTASSSSSQTGAGQAAAAAPYPSASPPPGKGPAGALDYASLASAAPSAAAQLKQLQERYAALQTQREALAKRLTEAAAGYAPAQASYHPLHQQQSGQTALLRPLHNLPSSGGVTFPPPTTSRAEELGYGRGVDVLRGRGVGPAAARRSSIAGTPALGMGGGSSGVDIFSVEAPSADGVQLGGGSTLHNPYHASPSPPPHHQLLPHHSHHHHRPRAHPSLVTDASSATATTREGGDDEPLSYLQSSGTLEGRADESPYASNPSGVAERFPYHGEGLDAAPQSLAPSPPLTLSGFTPAMITRIGASLPPLVNLTRPLLATLPPPLPSYHATQQQQHQSRHHPQSGGGVGRIEDRSGGYSGGVLLVGWTMEAVWASTATLAVATVAGASAGASSPSPSNAAAAAAGLLGSSRGGVDDRAASPRARSATPLAHQGDGTATSNRGGGGSGVSDSHSMRWATPPDHDHRDMVSSPPASSSPISADASTSEGQSATAAPASPSYSFAVLRYSEMSAGRGAGGSRRASAAPATAATVAPLPPLVLLSVGDVLGLLPAPPSAPHMFCIAEAAAGDAAAAAAAAAAADAAVDGADVDADGVHVDGEDGGQRAVGEYTSTGGPLPRITLISTNSAGAFTSDGDYRSISSGRGLIRSGVPACSLRVTRKGCALQWTVTHAAADVTRHHHSSRLNGGTSPIFHTGELPLFAITSIECLPPVDASGEGGGRYAEDQRAFSYGTGAGGGSGAVFPLRLHAQLAVPITPTPQVGAAAAASSPASFDGEPHQRAGGGSALAPTELSSGGGALNGGSIATTGGGCGGGGGPSVSSLPRLAALVNPLMMKLPPHATAPLPDGSPLITHLVAIVALTVRRIGGYGYACRCLVLFARREYIKWACCY